MSQQSVRTKPNPPAALALLPRVLRLGLLHLGNLSLQYPLRHLPTLWIGLRASRLNRIHANVENATPTETFVDYSHNSTNQLLTKKTYSSGRKPWVKGNLDEAGHVNLGSGPVAVKGDGSFEGQAPARTTTITAKDASGNVSSENWQLTSGSGTTRLPHSLL